MPRELPTYRDHIEQLNFRIPDKAMLSRKDLMTYTGLSLATVQVRYPFKGHFVSKVKFAHMLAQEDNA